MCYQPLHSILTSFSVLLKKQVYSKNENVSFAISVSRFKPELLTVQGWKFNPSLKIGNVMIRNNQVCIDNQKPRAFYYKLSRPEIIDNDLITNTTNLCDNLNKCSPIYFFSDNDLVINGTDVIIKDAMPAEDANPILRCLPLVCDTNASFDVNLQDVVYIEIKQENGTFDVKRYLLE